MQEKESLVQEQTRSRLFILVSPPKEHVGVWGSQELAPGDAPLPRNLFCGGKDLDSQVGDVLPCPAVLAFRSLGLSGYYLCYLTRFGVPRQ
jgi:hypothetical protein